MIKEIRTRLAMLALACAMIINMVGCKSSEKSQNDSSSFEIVTEVDENVNEINSTKCYSAKNIYVVTATTLSGNRVTYLATPYSTITEVYYLELKTGCSIERINNTTELVKYLDVDELKEEYTETEIMELYSQISGSNVAELEYPVSRYADCPVETSQEEEYKAAYLHLFVGKDNDGKEELYLVRHENTFFSISSAEIYDFFTDIHLKSYYEFISSVKWAPLCEYIPLSDRKEDYTSEELKVILDYARQVFHKNRDFDPNLSIDLRSLGQKYSEEQVLVLDTSKLMNFGEVEDSKKVHILLLNSASEDKIVFNYSELGSSNDVATLIINENGYTLGYSEKENGVAYIADSKLNEDALLPLNEFLAKNGYENSIKIDAFTGNELQTLEQGLQDIIVRKRDYFKW